MKPARFVVAALLSCVTLTPAVAHGEQDRDTKKNAKAQQAEQRRQARFRGMDTNRDGVITRQEWRGNDQSFRQHDTNRDGVLSGNEIWTKSGNDAEGQDWRSRADRDNVLAQTFRRSDANGDGIISRSEWASDSASFNRVDVNRDGVVTEREFLGEGWNDAVEPPGDRDPRRDTRAYQNGHDRGLLDGRQAGREDRARNTWDLDGQRELEQADAGYTAAAGAREDYQAGYRAGFRAGYRQGFGPRVP
jgi:hypothetical protein